MRVTKYNVTVEDTHLKKLKVIRFNGNKRRFIIGFTTREVTPITKPANKREEKPFSNTIPDAVIEAKYITTVSMTKIRNNLLTN